LWGITSGVHGLHRFYPAPTIKTQSFEYKMDGVGDELKLMSTFEVAAGVANVREGYYGWRWVDTIDPVAVERINLNPDGNEL